MKRLIPFLFLVACHDIVIQPPAKTPRPTPTHSATRTPTPEPTPTPPPVRVERLTSGSATIRIDLSEFKPNGAQEYYPAFTMMWDPEDLHAPALEISVLAIDNQPCEVRPCKDKIGIRVRFSGDILDTKRVCGEGTNSRNRLSVGPARIFDLKVQWSWEGVEVWTPTDHLFYAKGSPRVGFGWWTEGVPGKNGIGWGRGVWELRKAGGRAQLLDWRSMGPLTDLKACP